MSKHASPTPQTPPSDAIESAVASAQTALRAITSRLLEDSATARHGVRAAQDAIADLDRALSLCDYEAKRQASVAQARRDRAAVDSALK